MFFVQCGFGNTARFYGPFASKQVRNLWLAAHIPTEAKFGVVSLCDENISMNNHQLFVLNDPMRGISLRATVDVEHALKGI